MSNETSSGGIENISLTMKTILVVPEFCNLGLLGIGLIQMYLGIEIGHPVYALLFANLCMAFFASLLGILSCFFLKDNIFLVGKHLKIESHCKYPFKF